MEDSHDENRIPDVEGQSQPPAKPRSASRGDAVILWSSAILFGAALTACMIVGVVNAVGGVLLLLVLVSLTLGAAAAMRKWSE